MSKEWKPVSWFNDPEQMRAECFFRTGNHRVLDEDTLQFDFVIYTNIGDLTIRGFRYKPQEDKLLNPCYRVGGGFQPTVRLEGPMQELVLETARSLSDKVLERELVETEQVEGEVVEARD